MDPPPPKISGWSRRGGAGSFKPITRSPSPRGSRQAVVVDVTEGSNVSTAVPPPLQDNRRARMKKASSIRYPELHRHDDGDSSDAAGVAAGQHHRLDGGHHGFYNDDTSEAPTTDDDGARHGGRRHAHGQAGSRPGQGHGHGHEHMEQERRGGGDDDGGSGADVEVGRGPGGVPLRPPPGWGGGAGAREQQQQQQGVAPLDEGAGSSGHTGSDHPKRLVGNASQDSAFSDANGEDAEEGRGHAHALGANDYHGGEGSETDGEFRMKQADLDHDHEHEHDLDPMFAVHIDDDDGMGHPGGGGDDMGMDGFPHMDDDMMFKEGEQAMDEMIVEEGMMEERNGVLNYELRERPETLNMFLYAFQHIIALVGSIVVIPKVLVPRMGGSDVDTAEVIQAVMMVTGISTALHVLFGSRLPLMQGSTLVYLAPALVIANSPGNLAADASSRFSVTMSELMGAVLCASGYQLLVGCTGFMGLLIELINPVVVAPTIAAVGLSFMAYGFPQVGACVAIGLPQITLIVVFALYLRRVSFWGSRFFQIHAISLGLGITWLYAFILTCAGAYSYTQCSSTNLLDSASTQCAAATYTARQCRTDESTALSGTPWFPPPYPFRFGMPTVRWESVCVMLTAAIISTVDSVGNYHATSLLVASRPPTGGVVSRGIMWEGVGSVLAGMWGTGTGATTLTENIHMVAVTRMGSRVTVLLAAGLLVFFSLFGKVGALLATIPPVIVGGLMVIMASMTCALGLSSLRYAEMGSSRNLLITALALYLSLSVPEYFRSFTATNGHGPINTSNSGVNFVLNSIFSLNMVVAFLVAFLLDNTVPGSATERGLYVWSGRKAAQLDDSVVADYSLPWGMGRWFFWAWWLGV